MKAVENLPQGYNEIYSLNLKTDKKLSLIINLIAVLIAVLMAVPMHFAVSVFTLYDMEDGMKWYIIRIVTLLVLTVLYLILHELVHGIAMKICGTKKVKYGFTGLYAFACSDDYYGKAAYIFIALAPVVFWGVVLAVINPIVPVKWFWVVYLIQIFNLSGAAGDLFVTFKFSRMPSDILIGDCGVGMTVYSKQKSDSE